MFASYPHLTHPRQPRHRHLVTLDCSPACAPTLTAPMGRVRPWCRFRAPRARWCTRHALQFQHASAPGPPGLANCGWPVGRERRASPTLLAAVHAERAMGEDGGVSLTENCAADSSV